MIHNGDNFRLYRGQIPSADEFRENLMSDPIMGTILTYFLKDGMGPKGRFWYRTSIPISRGPNYTRIQKQCTAYIAHEMFNNHAHPKVTVVLPKSGSVRFLGKICERRTERRFRFGPIVEPWTERARTRSGGPVHVR